MKNLNDGYRNIGGKRKSFSFATLGRLEDESLQVIQIKILNK